MTGIVLTTTPDTGYGSLILDDGEREVELVKDSDYEDGIYLVDFKPPVPVPVNTYAEGADSEGRVRTRTKYPNPEGTGLVRIVGDTDTFWGHVENFEDIVTSTHSHRGTMRYVPPDGVAVTLDLESIHIAEMPHDVASRRRMEVSFSFECKPFGRLDPDTLVSGEVISGPVDTFEVEDVGGHAEAFGEMTLTDTSTQSSDHIEVGLEHHGYDPSSPSQIVLSDAELVITGFAGANATIAGSYATNTKRATLAASPVVVCSTGPQPHIGRKKIRARVYASADIVYVRLAWRVGDGPFTRGPWVRVPGAGTFYDVALDVIRIAEVPSGSHSWEGYIEAYTTTTTTTLAVDFVEVFPAEVYALIRSPLSTETPGAFTALDEFNQTAGNLDAPKAAQIGGNWAEAVRTGANGFQTSGTPNFNLTRTTVSDASELLGSFAFVGSAVASCEVQAEVKFSVAVQGVYGLLARYVDSSNYLRAFLRPGIGAGLGLLQVYKVIAGSPTNITSASLFVPSPYWGAVNIVYPLKLTIDAAGNWALYAFGYLQGTGSDSDLATGGTLASGKVGLYDAHPFATASTRTYDNFVASTPAGNHALWPGQSARLLHDSYYRENSGGTGEGKLPIEGQFLRIPPSTRAGRIARIAIKRRRLDNDGGLPDQGLSDASTADLTVTPRVLLSGA